MLDHLLVKIPTFPTLKTNVGKTHNKRWCGFCGGFSDVSDVSDIFLTFLRKKEKIERKRRKSAQQRRKRRNFWQNRLETPIDKRSTIPTLGSDIAF